MQQAQVEVERLVNIQGVLELSDSVQFFSNLPCPFLAL